MSKPCHFFFQNKNWLQIFTINKTNIMRKSKYQHHCFIVCMLVPYAFCFSYQQNIVTLLISTALRDAALNRGEALIKERCLFHFGYLKVRRLLQRHLLAALISLLLHKSLSVTLNLRLIWVGLLGVRFAVRVVSKTTLSV